LRPNQEKVRSTTQRRGSAIYGPSPNIPEGAAEILSLIQKHRLAA
jgi:hypothetical protein